MTTILQPNSFRKILFWGVLLELAVFIFFYFNKEGWGDTFRYAARYSGRVSLIIYLYCFYLFVSSYRKNTALTATKNAVTLFSVLHLIHFIFLALSVYFNQLPVVIVKLTGGFLAYVLIIAYPFFIERIRKTAFHFIYFYYVGFVMAMTYIARIRGDFEGASPELFHYFGLGAVGVAFVLFGYQCMTKGKPNNP